MHRCAKCHRRLARSISCPDDGWTQPAASITPPIDAGEAPRIEGVIVGDPLGAGGFAVAWGAARRADGAAVVLKVGRSTTPVIVERFQREAAAMERVGPPHVPRLYGSGRTDDGRPFLVMERIDGETLGQRLARMLEPPEPEWVARVGDSILAALEAAHARGVVHRDLKPENIFLSGPEERAVLLDFGLVKRTDGAEAHLTRSGVAVGTLEYMAPEQIAGSQEVGPAADVYAMGIVLYEMVTLRPPFAGERGEVEHGHLALRPPRPSAYAVVPAAIEELVLACLAKEPARRPPDAVALRRALPGAAALRGAAAASPRAAPAGARGAAASSRGGSLIADASQPVVLAAIETDGDAGAVVDAITRGGGFVARRQGRRYVAVFSGHQAEEPATAALASARALAEQQGARASLHLASVVLRRREGASPTAYGAAVDSPGAWMPPEPWSGVRWTAAFDAALPDGQRAPAEAAGAPEITSSGERLIDARIAAPLIGREDVLAALEASARVPFTEGRPALLTIIGDHGLGKSRLITEAAAIARRVRPDARVLVLGGDAGRGARGLAGKPLGGLDAPDEVAQGGSGRTRAVADALALRARSGPVAVVLDDAQAAEPDVVDALEFATLDGEDLPLWVVVAAHPRFEAARPGWGARTTRHDRAALAPLAAPDASRLAGELLRPAEFPPAAVLERLAQWSAGNPAGLVQITRALKRAGVVRRRSGTESWYVATADLDALPPSPAWQWLVTRRIGALPPDLGALARLCAVLGATFWREELERVQDGLERSGHAGTRLDVGYGLRALAEAGILDGAPGERWAFQDALFQDALYELLNPAQRAAVHEQALDYWRWKGMAPGPPAAAEAPRSGPGLVEILEALARHAAAAGARDEAADALLRLGDMALSGHRHVEADQRYTAALASTREGDAVRRMRALAGRGKSRVTSHRPREAQEDLEEARRLAASLGDSNAVAELLLEEATALDWEGDFERSGARTDEARPLVGASGSRRLQARLVVADGRAAFRRARIPASISLLEQGLAMATDELDYDSQVIALLLLGGALSIAERPAEAELCLDRAIALTSCAHDLPHLCMAHLNRTHVWLARREPDRAIGDLSRAVVLAREMGNPNVERAASLSLGEILYWAGRSEDALLYARRARLLEERFHELPSAHVALLLARILVEMDAMGEARRLVEQVQSTRPNDLAVSQVAPGLTALLAMLELILDEASATEAGGARYAARWTELCAQAERLLDERAIYPDDLLEFLYWGVRTSLRSRRFQDAESGLERAAGWLSKGSAVWTARFEDLRRELGRMAPDARPREGVAGATGQGVAGATGQGVAGATGQGVAGATEPRSSSATAAGPSRVVKIQ
ncbi:MAG: protein kinase [Polyangiaceae bacterium]|nr:protein kinase [Polyangiaceae bacterium]